MYSTMVCSIDQCLVEWVMCHPLGNAKQGLQCGNYLDWKKISRQEKTCDNVFVINPKPP